MHTPSDNEERRNEQAALAVALERAARYKAALHRSAGKIARYRRRLRPRPYSLREYDRMKMQRFAPAFLFPEDMPAGLRVLVVLPHHHEAAKIGGLVRVMLAEGGDGRPRSRLHAVVVMPSHRSITGSNAFRRREDQIDAVRKEMLDWAHVIGLDLGVPPWSAARNLKDPSAELPPESAYVLRRSGDQFIYGPEGQCRFFNAWKTYDTGEHDPNCQRVAPEDQAGFRALVRETEPDVVLLPDRLDPHPSHRTTRELAMDALRAWLADCHSRGAARTVTLLECASFQLLTPPRYNLWVMAPKDVTRLKTLANKAFRLSREHDYEMDQMMAERVVSMAAGDEFSFVRTHPEKRGFEARLALGAPKELPANITAECYTVGTLGVTILKGTPVVREARAAAPRAHLLALGSPARAEGRTSP